MARRHFQTGYLTLKGYDKDMDTYRLGLPNREVSEGFFKDLLPKIGISFSPQTRNIDRWIIRTN